MQRSAPLKTITLATLLALASFNTAHADNVASETVTEYTLLDSVMEGKPMTSFRLRYEEVKQAGFQPGAPNITPNDQLKDAEGITLRSLIGWQTAPFHNLALLHKPLMSVSLRMILTIAPIAR